MPVITKEERKETTFVDELGDVNIKIEIKDAIFDEIKYTGKRLIIHNFFKELRRDEMNISDIISVSKYKQIMKYLNDNNLELNKENIRKFVLSSGHVRLWTDYGKIINYN